MGSLEFDLIERDPDEGLYSGMGHLRPLHKQLDEEVVLNNGRVIPVGSSVARLHLGIPEDSFDEWRKLSDSGRARMAAGIALDGLIDTAVVLATNLDLVDDLLVFHGRSHLVKPGFFQDLGFTVREASVSGSNETREYTATRQKQIYGTEQASKMNVGKIYEFFATPEQMIAALPKLSDTRDRIKRRAPIAAGK